MANAADPGLNLADSGGVEPPASWASRRRSTGLSYESFGYYPKMMAEEIVVGGGLIGLLVLILIILLVIAVARRV